MAVTTDSRPSGDLRNSAGLQERPCAFPLAVTLQPTRPTPLPQLTLVRSRRKSSPNGPADQHSRGRGSARLRPAVGGSAGGRESFG